MASTSQPWLSTPVSIISGVPKKDTSDPTVRIFDWLEIFPHVIQLRTDSWVNLRAGWLDTIDTMVDESLKIYSIAEVSHDAEMTLAEAKAEAAPDFMVFPDKIEPVHPMPGVDLTFEKLYFFSYLVAIVNERIAEQNEEADDMEESAPIDDWISTGDSEDDPRADWDDCSNSNVSGDEWSVSDFAN